MQNCLIPRRCSSWGVYVACQARTASSCVRGNTRRDPDGPDRDDVLQIVPRHTTGYRPTQPRHDDAYASSLPTLHQAWATRPRPAPSNPIRRSMSPSTRSAASQPAAMRAPPPHGVHSPRATPSPQPASRVKRGDLAAVILANPVLRDGSARGQVACATIAEPSAEADVLILGHREFPTEARIAPSGAATLTEGTSRGRRSVTSSSLIAPSAASRAARRNAG